MNASFLDISQKDRWRSVLCGKSSAEDITFDYLTGKLALNYLTGKDETIIYKGINILINALVTIPISRIRKLLASGHTVPCITASNIPQFSNFASVAVYLPTLLASAKEPITYCDLGYALYSDTKNDGAAIKYGQNHGNLAQQLDLAQITKKECKKAFEATLLTSAYCKLEHYEKMDLLQRLCFRIPIIQAAAISENPTATVEGLLAKALAESTCNRRRPNVLEVLAFTLDE